ncbi:MAG: 23S rRNA (pseudouridine(1915)-N(3))-methyltransferase RlmH [Candidatus Sericytochromatia bacterium]
MKINIISLGKIKEKYFKDCMDEYTKRLTSYCSLVKTELEDEKLLVSQKEEFFKMKEGEKILKVLNTKSYKIALSERGKNLTSEEFADFIKNITNNGYSEISFIIGGALGLSEEVLNKSDYKLSLSKMTFTHQMVYSFLLEQIYRAFKIMNNEPYHK